MPWKALKTAAGSGWKEIDRAAGTGWKELSWDVVNIDIGQTAGAGSGGWNANGQTLLCFTNPANTNGIVDKLDIRVNTAGDGCIRIGSVYLISGNTYKCRDAENISGLSAGLNSDVAISLSVESGDYIACYQATGSAKSKIDTGSGTRALVNALIVGSEFVYEYSYDYDLMVYASNY